MKLIFLTSFYFITMASLSASNHLADQSLTQPVRYIARINSSLCDSTTSCKNPYKEQVKSNQSPFFRAETIAEFVLRGDFFYEKGYLKEAFSDWNYAKSKGNFDALLRIAMIYLHGRPELGIPTNPAHSYKLICDLSDKEHFPSMYQRALIDFNGCCGLPRNTYYALNTMQILSTQGYTPAIEFLNNA